MKYIFLDIDGVLTTLYETMDLDNKLYWKDNDWARKLNVHYPFNNKCVDIFNNILEKTNCDIILTSDWRKNKKTEQLDIIFKNNGVIKSPIDVTPNYRDNYSNFEYARSIEIVHYIVENSIDINNIVIIDDMNLEMLFPPKLRTRFIKTQDGIKEEDKNKIIELLK